MRERAVHGIALGALVLLALDALAARAGWVPGIVPRVDGPWAWLASRAAGWTAYVALALDVALGLAVSGGLADRLVARGRVLQLHRWLSGASVGIAALHALALLADRVAALDLLDLAIPSVSRYRPAAVACGITALATTVLVRRSFAWRAAIGARAWKALHALAFVAFALATVHGIAAGSDSGAPWARATYLAASVIVAALLIRRGSARAARPRPRPA